MMSSKKHPYTEQFIGKKIRAYRKDIGLTVAVFADLIGISQGSLSDLENNRSFPSGETILKLIRCTDIDIDWLIGFEGEVSNKDSAETPAPEVFDRHLFCFVPKAEAVLSAGAGAVVLSERFRERYAFRKDWLRRIVSGLKEVLLMDVSGDSMSPTLQSGDMVLIDRGRTRLQTGAIYAFNPGGDMIQIKRLDLRGDKVLVISDNSEIYPRYEIPTADVHIIGQVIWFSRELVVRE